MPDDPVITKRMSEIISRWEKKGDRRAIFLGCYALMTGNMLMAARNDFFQDSVWVKRLVHYFAGYYFDALEAYERSAGEAPAAWRLTHDAAGDSETKVLQNLLLGINAHVNYDLGLSVTDLLDSEWPALTEGQREARYHDYYLVNQIIADTVDSVQDQVVERYSPVMEIVDALFGPLDEWLASMVIDHWRDEVWQQATDMLDSPLADRRESMRLALEETAVERANLILLG